MSARPVVTGADARTTEPGPVDWFTGTVYLDTLAQTPPPSHLHVHRVTFAPDARTAWHTHPLGQVLHAVSGEGRLYVEGDGLRRLGPGDTAVVPPATRHWHGAAPGQLFVHIAVQQADPATDETATWHEHVTDADYHRTPDSTLKEQA